MQIIKIEHLNELPGMKWRAYAIGEKFTAENAAQSYEHRYGVIPERAWLWVSTLYIPEPAGRNDQK